MESDIRPLTDDRFRSFLGSLKCLLRGNYRDCGRMRSRPISKNRLLDPFDNLLSNLKDSAMGKVPVSFVFDGITNLAPSNGDFDNWMGLHRRQRIWAPFPQQSL